jgi:hypothetical protein
MSACQLWLMSDTAQYRFTLNFRGLDSGRGILSR